MDRSGIVGMIDEALERFATRERVAASEVVDLLLDLRSAVLSDAELHALIDSERQPTA